MCHGAFPTPIGSGLHQDVSRRQKYVDNLTISCELSLSTSAGARHPGSLGLGPSRAVFHSIVPLVDAGDAAAAPAHVIEQSFGHFKPHAKAL